MKKLHTVDVLYDKGGQDYYYREESVLAENKKEAASAAAHTIRRRFRITSRIDAHVWEEGDSRKEFSLVENIQ